jgi:hypothetical protein
MQKYINNVFHCLFPCKSVVIERGREEERGPHGGDKQVVAADGRIDKSKPSSFALCITRTMAELEWPWSPGTE